MYTFLVFSLILNVVFVIIYYTSFSKINNTGLYDVNNTIISYAFSGIKGNPEQEVIKLINNSSKTLDIAIYNLDNEKIVDALLGAQKRKVNIRIITDKDKASKKTNSKIIETLINSNIQVKYQYDTKMHLKIAIADSETIISGSFNFTEASAEENQEVVLMITDKKIAQEWENIFNDLWERETD